MRRASCTAMAFCPHCHEGYDEDNDTQPCCPGCGDPLTHDDWIFTPGGLEDLPADGTPGETGEEDIF